MLKTRLIACVLLRNGLVVQSKGFKRYQVLGNPTTIVSRFSDWSCDELIYLDISREPAYDLRRDDLNHPNAGDILQIVAEVSARCFMPLTFGGRIRTLGDAADRMKRGADKIAINTAALDRPEFITECARAFGSQSVVLSIDVRRTDNGDWQVFKEGGRTPTRLSVTQWARQAEERGAGEILLNSIDRDGSGAGYDIELLDAVASGVRVPVIALGGAGHWSHFAEALTRTKVSAVAAANVFHYTEQSIHQAKKCLYEAGFNVRRPAFLTT